MNNTTYFDLNKPELTDSQAVSALNENMDIIDTEMHKPPLTVNNTSPNASRDIQITTVPLADNLTSDEAQVIEGSFVVRASAGGAPISTGSAFLSSIKGDMVKTGYSPQVCNMTVTNATRPDPDSDDITATIVDDTFRDAVENTTGTYLFIYSTNWTLNSATVTIADFGITVSGTPYAGDTITVQFIAESRGTITAAEPSSFISTGWNLYNHDTGMARVCKYSEQYGYKIAGTYTLLEFATTVNGQREQVNPVYGSFDVPGDGWLFVSGGNDTDTEIWAEWTDWGEEPNGGTFAPYTESEIDLSGIMVNFPDGLMRVGTVADELNFNTGIAYARIAKLDYTDYIQEVIASGQPYETDSDYVYVVRKATADGNIPPVSVYDISEVSGTYNVDDHGMEYFDDTSVALETQCFYGQSLKNKLRMDVLTISSEELTEAQKKTVMKYTGVTDAIATAKKSVTDAYDGAFLKQLYSYTYTVSGNGSATISAANFGISPISGYKMIGLYYFTSGTLNCSIIAVNAATSGSVMSIKNTSSSEQTKKAKLGVLWVKSRMLGG